MYVEQQFKPIKFLLRDEPSQPIWADGWLAWTLNRHNFWNFLAINSCSTCKKVLYKPKFVDENV